MARLAATGALNRGAAPLAPIAGMTPYAHGQRETSAGPIVAGAGGAGSGSDSKRRRLNASLGALPTPTSGLARQSPGIATPKAGTPSAAAAAGARAGSAGPGAARPNRKTIKKVAPHHQGPLRKKVTKISSKRSGARSARTSASPDMTADSGSGDEGSIATPGTVGTAGGRGGGHHDGAADEDDGGEEMGYDEDDKNVYCTCRSLSHGNMVACDNENCRYEWFHWECVGLSKEPVGRWLCPECKKLPASQVKVAK